MGPDFQANLPPCFADGRQSGLWLEGGSLKERLLWTPLDKKEETGELPGQGEQHTVQLTATTHSKAAESSDLQHYQ